MDESPFIKSSYYFASPSAYVIDGYVYDTARYISSIDTYSIINDFTQYGEHFSTSEELFSEYGVTVDAYVYEPPIARYPSWTFGEAILAVLKVAGVVVGCITFVYSAINGTLIALLKTVPYALLDLKDLVVGAVTKTSVFIFPRIQELWPEFYDSIVSLFTHGQRTGWMPYYGYINGKRTLLWTELNPTISASPSLLSEPMSPLGSVLDWKEIEKHANIGEYKKDMDWFV